MLGAVVLAVFAMLLLVTAGPAAAKKAPPCWKTLINDWYDGRIDGTYPIHCYRDALKHLPTDVETYSSARDDIKQALQKRITQSHQTPGNSSGNNSGPIPPGGNKNGPSNPNNPSSPSTNKPSSSSNSPIKNVFNATKPGKATSLPIPLIVLGAVALLLMAAGAAGFVTRRTRTRRLQLASATTLPKGPGGPPPENP
jgi:hypothetical protein